MVRWYVGALYVGVLVCCVCVWGVKKKERMASAGFEPAPFQTSALNWRLRPLGQLTIKIPTRLKCVHQVHSHHEQTKRTHDTQTHATQHPHATLQNQTPRVPNNPRSAPQYAPQTAPFSHTNAPSGRVAESLKPISRQNLTLQGAKLRTNANARCHNSPPMRSDTSPGAQRCLAREAVVETRACP
jgi:hypothetical protein